jgi:hypothetical protein
MMLTGRMLRFCHGAIPPWRLPQLMGPIWPA